MSEGKRGSNDGRKRDARVVKKLIGDINKRNKQAKASKSKKRKK